jgi:hypothetical protein
MGWAAAFVFVFGLVLILGLTGWAIERRSAPFGAILLLGAVASLLLGVVVGRL